LHRREGKGASFQTQNIDPLPLDQFDKEGGRTGGKPVGFEIAVVEKMIQKPKGIINGFLFF
jgi:hypothetical protein